MPDEPKTPAPTGLEAQGPQYPTDSSHLSTIYTNFCRVSVTPEEIVLDFGLNTQLTPTPTEPIKLSHRVVMNYYTAKRLLGALHAVVSNYEGTYGPLELDFQRRVKGMQRTAGIQRPGGA